MEEAHYDTPWEFKNRGLAALRQRPHSTSSPTPNSIGVATSPTNPNNRTNFSGASERSENASVSPPRSISNQQLVHVLHSPSSEQSPRQPLVNVKRTHFPAITASTSAASTPVPEHRRRRSEKIENSKTTITHDKKHDLNYPHVRNHSYGLEFDLTDKRRAISNQQKQRYKYDESHILHDGIDRVEAEKMLQSLDIGDFLLRRRPEGNLALSLKASDGTFIKVNYI